MKKVMTLVLMTALAFGFVVSPLNGGTTQSVVDPGGGR